MKIPTYCPFCNLSLLCLNNAMFYCNSCYYKPVILYNSNLKSLSFHLNNNLYIKFDFINKNISIKEDLDNLYSFGKSLSIPWFIPDISNMRNTLDTINQLLLFL